MASRGACVFLTGLPAAGKTSIGKALEELLPRFGRTVTFLDGDEIRALLSPDLGYSCEDRAAHIRRIGFIAGEVVRHGGIAVCAAIAPRAEHRAAARRFVAPHGPFVLVHVTTHLATCESRDPKGLYRRARAGLISEFTGVSAPYEPPDDASLVVDGEAILPADAAARIVRHLQQLGCIGLLSSPRRRCAPLVQPIPASHGSNSER